MEKGNLLSRVRESVLDHLVGYMIAALFALILFGWKALGYTWADTIAWSVFVAAMLTVLVYFLDRMSKNAKKRRLANRTPAEIKAQILEWFLRYKFSVQEDPHPAFEFRIVATVPKEKLPITVLLERGMPWVKIGTHIEIAKASSAILVEEESKFRRRLDIELTKMGVEFSINYKAGVADDIMVMNSIVFGASTGDLEFLLAVQLVRRAAHLIDLMGKDAVAAERLKRSATNTATLPSPKSDA